MNKQNFTKIVKNEFTGWTFLEILWLIFSSLSIFIISRQFKENYIGILGAVCGITASVLTGKGKLSAYIIGGIGKILYAIIALKAHFYGEVILNLLYFIPMEFYGIYEWNKNMNPKTHEVNKRSMTINQLLVTFISIFILTIIIGYILSKLGGSLPYIDSLTNTLSIIAMILTIKRYWQQWILWLITNIISIFMWIYSLKTGNGNIAILLMWIIYFINSLIMMIKWKKQK